MYLAVTIKKESEMVGLPNNQMTKSDWKALETFLLLVSNMLVAEITIALFIIMSEVGLYKILTNAALVYVDILSIVLFLDPIVILRNADARAALKGLCKSRKYDDNTKEQSYIMLVLNCIRVC